MGLILVAVTFFFDFKYVEGGDDAKQAGKIQNEALQLSLQPAQNTS